MRLEIFIMLTKIKRITQENRCFIMSIVILIVSLTIASYGLQARANGWQPEVGHTAEKYWDFIKKI